MITLKYWNPKLQIGLCDLRNVYQFPQQEKMLAEVHQGRLHYRCRGSSHRTSYAQIKKGLLKRIIHIPEEPVPF